jgi:hypothetical protein
VDLTLQQLKVLVLAVRLGSMTTSQTNREPQQIARSREAESDELP